MNNQKHLHFKKITNFRLIEINIVSKKYCMLGGYWKEGGFANTENYCKLYCTESKFNDIVRNWGRAGNAILDFMCNNSRKNIHVTIKKITGNESWSIRNLIIVARNVNDDFSRNELVVHCVIRKTKPEYLRFANCGIFPLQIHLVNNVVKEIVEIDDDKEVARMKAFLRDDSITCITHFKKVLESRSR